MLTFHSAITKEIANAEAIIQTGNDIVKFSQYAKFIGIFLLGTMLITSLCRFLFNKKAQLNIAMISAIEIIFVYVIAVVVWALDWNVSVFITPLPFVTLSEQSLIFYPVLGSAFPALCSQLLRLLMIAFLVNLMNVILPRPKKLLRWILLRLLSVIVAIGLIYLLELVLQKYLPQDFFDHAPKILLLSLLALILLGSMRVQAGTALVFLNPILAVLYTFFFSNLIGRALSRAILSTALITGLVVALNALKIYAITVSLSTFLLCLPLLLLVLGVWILIDYVFFKK